MFQSRQARLDGLEALVHFLDEMLEAIEALIGCGFLGFAGDDVIAVFVSFGGGSCAGFGGFLQARDLAARIHGLTPSGPREVNSQTRYQGFE